MFRIESLFNNKIIKIFVHGINQSYEFDNCEPTVRLERAWNYPYDSVDSIRSLLNEFEVLSLCELAVRIEKETNIDRVFQIIKKHIEPYKKEVTGRNTRYFLVILRMLKTMIPNYYCFKYQSIYDFISRPEYHDLEYFSTKRRVASPMDDVEWGYLMHEANWMNILLKITDPIGKKNIFLETTTKLIEGPDVRYITGSGQSIATLRRVHVFESETLVKPLSKPRRPKDDKLAGDFNPYLNSIPSFIANPNFANPNYNYHINYNVSNKHQSVTNTNNAHGVGTFPKHKLKRPFDTMSAEEIVVVMNAMNSKIPHQPSPKYRSVREMEMAVKFSRMQSIEDDGDISFHDIPKNEECMQTVQNLLYDMCDDISVGVLYQDELMPLRLMCT